MIPTHINSLQWHQALGVARQSCARFFRDGHAPTDAMAAFGIDRDDAVSIDWDKAVQAIAGALCVTGERRAA